VGGVVLGLLALGSVVGMAPHAPIGALEPPPGTPAATDADDADDTAEVAVLLAGTIDGDDAEALAARYLPLISIKEQTEPCDGSGEAWLPTPVDIVLDNPEVLLRQSGRGDPVIMRAPGGGDLYRASAGLFLDFPGFALDPDCIFERDFARFSAGVPATVYARVAQQADRSDQIVLQYWFFWYFNRWNNLHEGDWEGIQLIFDASTVAEALTQQPSEIAYAQHEGGEASGWDDAKLERVGSRPVVYSSAGSHASYYSSAVFLGRRGTEGFGCDVTTGPSSRVDPDMVLLPADVSGPDDSAAWLTFEGRWGEFNPGPNNGPTGPAFKERWTHPIDWQDSARRNSVVIPGGDGPTAAAIGVFCSATAAGSVLLTRALTTPAVLFIPLMLIAGLMLLLSRRTIWTAVDPLPVVAPRRAGQILRGALDLSRRLWPAFAVIAAVYIPTAIALGGLVALADALPGVRNLLELGSDTAGISALLALFIGGISTAFAFNVVIAAVTQTLVDEPSGSRRELAQRGWVATRAVLQRWHGLFSALLWASVVISLLLFSIVGAPIALWLIIRYQFIAEVVTAEGCGPRQALRRSAQLVRGRWWSTATVVLIIDVVVLLVSTTASLLVLVWFTGLPLWIFPAVSMLLTALIAPVAASAHVLLYGDRRCGEADTDDSAPADVRTGVAIGTGPSAG
jgi:hypothetical protein